MTTLVDVDKSEQPIAADGRPVNGFRLENSKGTSARFMDIGATWLSWKVVVDGNEREVLLGNANFKDYQTQTAYLGATVGRYANRIANGRFSIDGIEYHIGQNDGANALHGGCDGFDKRRWHLESLTKSRLSFSLHSDHGDQGFPGQLSVNLTITLDEDDALHLQYCAVVDQPCPVNLTNHAYFDLAGQDGKQGCLDHWLTIYADQYLPVGADGIPFTGLRDVEGTYFDFRQPKRIGEHIALNDELTELGGYDHSYYLAPRNENLVAEVVSPDSKLTMRVFSDKPAMQFYSGNHLKGCPNRCGGKYGTYSGFALETQFLPDSPNHLEWPQEGVILMPGQVYQYTTTYQLIVSE
ncbi:galactose-1-epimerase [Thaumasiovibrio sp. DFM-14]|uniref:galactose-1-epimerase n=1 Tax=Thaumasiovibrio sp. DFM-14 TaxID=3384792 RepID=UPI0039A0A69C